MSDEDFTREYVDLILSAERQLWVEVPADYYDGLGVAISGLLEGGVLAMSLGCERIRELPIKPNPGMVHPVAWVKSGPQIHGTTEHLFS
jgi:hypothetical protein